MTTSTKVSSSLPILLAALCFCACGKKPDASNVRFGPVSEALSDDTSFYSIAGGSDYSRLPLRNPWHIIHLNKEFDLMRYTSSELRHILDVGAKNGVFFGTARGAEDGRFTLYWALRPDSLPELKKFTTPEGVVHLPRLHPLGGRPPAGGQRRLFLRERTRSPRHRAEVGTAEKAG